MLRALRDFYLDAPDEAALAFMYMTAPPEPFIPEEWQGRLVAAIAGMWIGPMDDGASALRPLVDAARPVVDLFGEMPYTELQSMIDDPPGMRNWWTADYLDELPDAAVDAFCAYVERMPLQLDVPAGDPVGRSGGARERRVVHAEPRRGVGRPPVRALGGRGAGRRAHRVGRVRRMTSSRRGRPAGRT